MWKGTDEVGGCLLGYPKKQLHSHSGDTQWIKSPSADRKANGGVLDLTFSTIGGYARWHDFSTAPLVEDLCCRSCGALDDVVLVMQIYAPTEIERSLYVFCCNKRSCSLKAEGWMVLRNQSMVSQKEQIVSAPPQAVAEAEGGRKKTSEWDFLLPPENSGSAGMGGNMWSIPGADIDVSALDALLEERDRSLQQQQEQVLTRSFHPSAVEGDDGRLLLVTTTSLPCWMLAEEEEVWTLEDEAAALEGVSCSDISDEAHIEHLLQSYMRDEEEQDIVRIIQRQREGKSGANTNAEDDDSDEAESLQTHRDHQSSTGSSKSAQGEEDAFDKSFARNSANERLERYFQLRVSRHPTQVLRYAYGGAPMWASQPPSGAAAVPCCELCGANRVFECQLMPALLSFITTKAAIVVEPPAQTAHIAAKLSGTSSAAPLGPSIEQQQQLLDALGSDLDFGVVAVWSCPNSCIVEAPIKEGERCFAREYVVVQPPPDYC